ncbi:polysaccharide biosynthesis protein [Polaromonas sp. CG9_12]|nr:polysaccharide biosynthesis protein [Polaromonas sp. CG9_12]
MRIAVTIFSQIIAVPIYLHYWSIETYGAWILVQSIVSFLTIFDIAHHNYLGNEFLKTGRQNRSEIAAMFSTGMLVAFIVSIFTFTIICILALSGTISQWVGISAATAQPFEIALLLTCGTWVLTITFTGLLGRVLNPFGYFPLSAWSGVLFAIISTAASVAAVYFGAGLVATTIATCVATFICHSMLAVILFRIARQEKLISAKFEMARGFSRFHASLALGVQSGLEILRQQGVRFILLPLSGMGQMIAFATMRTGANLALQGVGTITAPLMPELMAFLVNRDQPRTESAFSVIWLMLCVVLVPAVLVVQYLAPTLFPIWTQGKIEFDPVLFALLSLAVLVYALAQPAIAVVNGNNLIREQVAISTFATVITVGGIYLLVPLMGVRGAALALLTGEVGTLLLYVHTAKKWLTGVGMRWPTSAFATASLSLVVAGLGMFSIIFFQSHAGLCLMLALVAQVLVLISYWSQLPLIAREAATTQAVRFLPQLLRKRLDKTVGSTS